MIKSMTSYVNRELDTPWGQLSVEMRSVNSRFLELSVRAPEELRALEPELRRMIQAKVVRGKVELNLRLRSQTTQDQVQIDMDALSRYADVANRIDGQFPKLVTDFARLLSLPGVINAPGIDSEGLHQATREVIALLVHDFIAAREREGQNLKQVIVARLDAIDATVGQVREWIPLVREAQRTRLEKRLQDIQTAIDPARLEQEVVIALTKLDVEEELDRLDSHLIEARRLLDLDDAVGRRLDFLLQEFNREANTLGSKSVDARMSNASVELKVLIDQIREQIQNIE